jgi:hypothetical protein
VNLERRAKHVVSLHERAESALERLGVENSGDPKR